MIVDNMYELSGAHEKINIDLLGKSNFYLGIIAFFALTI